MTTRDLIDIAVDISSYGASTPMGIVKPSRITGTKLPVVTPTKKYEGTNYYISNYSPVALAYAAAAEKFRVLLVWTSRISYSDYKRGIVVQSNLASYLMHHGSADPPKRGKYTLPLYKDVSIFLTDDGKFLYPQTVDVVEYPYMTPRWNTSYEEWERSILNAASGYDALVLGEHLELSILPWAGSFPLLFEGDFLMGNFPQTQPLNLQQPTLWPASGQF